ncbi:hypothetical protein CHLRE_01g005701v5 [Chlamydomonas reinhardtii]|uniref:Uncharacterized protein n=1 Tax=Chlamydomonas reinhardtii TaxID=3055 RepID=A0A2K3E508_CHLRE|nr:uncharacterized protein CHLRE_01g005701v5 [Chlamydomonas reinhardtii]XP_042928102.1 uncharacterized protein CHLRE_01g005701v5 [Chlamydomonas reinhardtii]PNW87881.1 hypothetical protein CHLRE_01g005701v5 [Chlamydomonas reinhardtii]PNW87882.1 hypothetical protein CHLRE_01g005701v5 [Chlamydomonas reinhardtii]
MLVVRRFVVHALFLLLCAGGLNRGAVSAAEALSGEDLLIVFPTFHKRIDTVVASRTWRRGVRTHIVVDDRVKLDELRAVGLEHNETFSAMPDLPGLLLSLRHVMSPVLAHRAVSGKYKWMLLGDDDDTLFSLPAVMAMLGKMKLSHTKPIAISDFLVRCHFENNKRHPRSPFSRDTRCPAPNATAAGGGGSKGIQPCMLPPERMQPPRFAKAPDCPPEGEISYYGGAGVILSQGLLRRLSNHHLRAHSVMVRSLANSRGTDESSSDGPAHASVVAKDDASFYAVVMSTFSEYGDTSMSEAWRRAGVGFTPPPPLPYQLRIPKHLMPQQGQEQEQEQGAQSRKLLGTPPLAPPSPPPHRLSCAKIKSTGAPPVECRRFGSLGYHMDRATPAEVLARHTDAAAASPEAFRLIVSAHLRPQHGVVDEAYLSTMTELGTLLAQDYEG